MSCEGVKVPHNFDDFAHVQVQVMQIHHNDQQAATSFISV